MSVDVRLFVQFSCRNQGLKAGLKRAISSPSCDISCKSAYGGGDVGWEEAMYLKSFGLNAI